MKIRYVWTQGPVTVTEPALICGFLAKMPFRRFLYIVSKISYFMKKSITYLYVQDELFSGLKLTILGEYFSGDSPVN
jgi:hypothetical protein